MTGAARALVVFPGALGDLVCALPAIEAIRLRSGARPTILCGRPLTALLEACGIADALPLEGPETGWLFSASPPPEARGFFGRFTSVDCFTGAGSPDVERNLAQWTEGAARVHRFRPQAHEHLAIHFLRCVGVETDVLPEARLRLPGALQANPTRERPPGVENRPLLVLHPGSGGRVKRWSRTGFTRLARAWESRAEVRIVLGEAEAGEIEPWRDLSVVRGLDLVSLAGILSRADLYVGNDSGPSHLAAAVGTRGVVLFGPTDPELWRPLSPRMRVVLPQPWSALEDDPPEPAIRALNQQLAEVLHDESP